MGNRPNLDGPMASAELHLIDPRIELGVDPMRLLSTDERERARRFVFEADGRRWSRFRAGLRILLGRHLGLAPEAVPIHAEPGGKPRLEPPLASLDFNLSHSDEFAVVAIAEPGPIGVDLEPLARAPELLGCEESFCHPQEIAALPEERPARARWLLELWIAKEALLKALGSGLGHPPQQLQVRGGRGRADPPLPGLESLRLERIEHPRLESHLLALALPLETERPILRVLRP